MNVLVTRRRSESFFLQLDLSWTSSLILCIIFNTTLSYLYCSRLSAFLAIFTFSAEKSCFSTFRSNLCALLYPCLASSINSISGDTSLTNEHVHKSVLLEHGEELEAHCLVIEAALFLNAIDNVSFEAALNILIVSYGTFLLSRK